MNVNNRRIDKEDLTFFQWLNIYEFMTKREFKELEEYKQGFVVSRIDGRDDSLDLKCGRKVLVNTINTNKMSNNFEITPENAARAVKEMSELMNCDYETA